METTLGDMIFPTWTESDDVLQAKRFNASSWAPTYPGKESSYAGDDDDGYSHSSNASRWFNSSTEQPTTQPTLHQIPPHLALRVVIGTTFLAVTIFGNVLVLYAYATTRALRTYTNHYIAGLAVADLISGGIIPGVENISWYLDTWPFSEDFCAATQYLIHIFLQITFMMTLVICYDRFRATNLPLKHLKEKTRKHACFMISLAYIIPILIWTPMIIIFPYTGFTVRVRPPLCSGSYAFHPPLLIIAVLILSWIPMTATIVLYAFVYNAVIRRGRRKNHKAGSGEPNKRVSSGVSDELSKKPNSDGCRPDDEPPLNEHSKDEEPTAARDQIYSVSGRPSLGMTNQMTNEQTEKGTNSTNPQETTAPTSEKSKMSSGQRKYTRRNLSTQPVVKRVQEGRLASLRATRTLTYILITTVVTAAPWSVFGLWAAIDSYDFPISNNEFKLLAWMAHLSSTLNPFCYAVCNPAFKQAFVRILCCRSRRAMGGTGRVQR